jgi:transposase
MKLTLGQAAKTAKRSKGTLSKALNSGGISAEKDDKGRWQIDPSELSRWMSANPFPNGRENQYETPEEAHENSALGVEVKMLRERIDTMTVERDRERGQLVDQIEDLRTRLDGAEAERTRLNALLTDQREISTASVKRGFWGRVLGK